MHSLTEMIELARSEWIVALITRDPDELVAAGNKLSSLLGDLQQLEARTHAPSLINA